MFSFMSYEGVSVDASTFVNWVLPVVVLVAGISLGLSIASFVISYIRLGGSGSPDVGSPDD